MFMGIRGDGGDGSQPTSHIYISVSVWECHPSSWGISTINTIKMRQWSLPSSPWSLRDRIRMTGYPNKEVVGRRSSNVNSDRLMQLFILCKILIKEFTVGLLPGGSIRRVVWRVKNKWESSSSRCLPFLFDLALSKRQPSLSVCTNLSRASRPELHWRPGLEVVYPSLLIFNCDSWSNACCWALGNFYYFAHQRSDLARTLSALILQILIFLYRGGL